MKKTFLATAVASLVSFVPVAQANLAQDTVVVTANRYAQTEASVLASTSVVTKEEIENLQAESALDVLAALPGIEVTSLGSKGQETSLFLRGTGSKHTLVLVDGVRVNSLTSGGSSIGLIPTFAIERIEVIRGPRAAVYGSDAIGGVISITTVPDAQSDQTLRLAYGSENHSQSGFRSAGALNEQTNGEVLAFFEKSDGYKVYESALGDSQGYDSKTLVGHLNHQHSQNWRSTFSGMMTDSEAQYASQYSGAQNRSLTNNYFLDAKTAYSNGRFSSEVELATFNNESQDGIADGSVATTVLDTRKNMVSWLNRYVLAEQATFNLGMEYAKDRANRRGSYTSDYEATDKETKSVFLTSSWNGDNLDLDGSLRRDDSSSYGEHDTWSLAVGYWLSEAIQLSASRGTAYKEPTFNDLYWPNQGNPDLKPESSKSEEIALKGYSEFVDWQISAYENQINNMIAWANPTGTWLPYNVDSANIKGLEVSANIKFDTMSHRLSAEWKDPRDESDDSLLARRARKNLSWTMNYDSDPFVASLQTLYTGEKQDGRVTLDDYVLLNFSVKFAVTDHAEIGLKVNNLLDKDYETAYGSNSYWKGQERNVLVGVNYQF